MGTLSWNISLGWGLNACSLLVVILEKTAWERGRKGLWDCPAVVRLTATTSSKEGPELTLQPQPLKIWFKFPRSILPLSWWKFMDCLGCDRKQHQRARLRWARTHARYGIGTGQCPQPSHVHSAWSLPGIQHGLTVMSITCPGFSSMYQIPLKIPTLQCDTCKGKWNRKMCQPGPGLPLTALTVITLPDAFFCHLKSAFPFMFY